MKQSSFSSGVKEELLQRPLGKGNDLKGELFGILLFASSRGILSGEGEYLRFSTENPEMARKCFTMLKKGFNIKISVQTRYYGKARHLRRYSLIFPDIIRDLEKECLSDKAGKKAFLRGAFLSAGSMSNPESGYHLEFVCDSEADRDLLLGVSDGFSLNGRSTVRKRSHVVYFKEGEAVSDLLNIMGAHKSLMELENTRILKEMRGNVNRRVNCETANIAKTVSAASRQLEDIAFLKEKGVLNTLPDKLREIALLRLEYPDATLNELGEKCAIPVGKSGINHRLRKLSEEAARIR